MTEIQWFAVGLIIIMTAWAITTMIFTFIKSIQKNKKNETDQAAEKADKENQ